MEEAYKILVGIGVLALGFPLGNLLARLTKEELKQGQFWFKLIILVSFIGAITTLLVHNDTLFFTFLFLIAVTSMSLRRKPSKNPKRNKPSLILTTTIHNIKSN